MTPDEFGSALAEFAPDDTKVVVTITSDRVVFSAIPRSKDSKSLPAREFSTTEPEIAEVPNKGAIDYYVVLALFGVEGASKAAEKLDVELTAAEQKSKGRVAEKIQLGRKPRSK